jgi:transcriptional regulator with XRE-family HTH domain
MVIGQKIKVLRESNRLSVEELGAATNLSPAMIKNWELGATKPNELEIQQLAAYFRISPDELISTTYIPNGAVPTKNKVGKAIGSTIKGFIKLIITFVVIGILIFLIYLFLTKPEIFNVTKESTITCTMKGDTYSVRVKSLAILKYNDILSVEGDQVLVDSIDFNKYSNVDDAFNALKAKAIKDKGDCKITGN